MLLPVLPLLIQELGVESNYVVAVWTGLLVGLYYAGRSGSLAAARVCPWALPANSFLCTSIVLALSAVTYAVFGQLVGPLGLRWLALFRFLSGILAALHGILGVGCLRVAAAHADNRSGMIDMGNGDRIPASRSFGATVAGRVMGCAVAGFLFSQGDVRPIGRLCLVWSIAHVPPALLLLVLWRRSTRSGNSRGWSALSSTDFGRVSIGSGVNDRRTEGSEIELVLSNGMGNGPDRDDGAREGRKVAARPSSPVAAPASRGGPAPPTVASDKIEVPQRYLRGCKGDPVEAERRWRLTLEWRARERIDGVRFFHRGCLPFSFVLIVCSSDRVNTLPRKCLIWHDARGGSFARCRLPRTNDALQGGSDVCSVVDSTCGSLKPMSLVCGRIRGCGFLRLRFLSISDCCVYNRCVVIVPKDSRDHPMTLQDCCCDLL